ncbi:restriction endonuclease subunit S [Enterococcus casseliflavus]|uniref:restriction endonuclease subunit S n=1 Tax=Enterococcus casseliflavus TaxID=37734 RepID=UPI00191AF5B6|nr:restriction endonuclease subunit S [Enterococcus casseliflavus]QQU17149.1 restriction endonuclease subunit S [Enterococcus casseliflavus]
MMNRSMKDSGVEWIGDIPEYWNIVRVKRLFTYKKEKVGVKSEDYERLSLTLKGVLKRPKNDSEGLQPEKFSGYQIIEYNDLVFKLIDLENISTSRVGLSNFTGIVSPAYLRLICSDDVDSKFGYYFFISMWYQNIFNGLGGDGVRSNLNSSDLLNLSFVDVPKSEQQKIAAFLDEKVAHIDNIIEETKKSIENLKAYKQSLITETVTKGLNPNVEMKDSGIDWIGDIPKYWKIYKIGQIFKEHKEKNEGLIEDNLLSLSYGKVKRRDIKSKEGLLPQSFEGYNIIKPGDIVLRMTDLQNDQKSLRVGLCKEKGIITSAYISIRAYNNIYPHYAYYYLHSFDIYKGFYGMGLEFVKVSTSMN